MSNEAQHYTPGFIANLNLAPGQNEARLVNCVMADLAYTKEGKMFNADDIGQDDDEVDIIGKAPLSPESFADHKRRVGFFKARGKGRFLESLEVVRMLQDPTNTVMAGIMSTKKRATDDTIIAGLNAAANEGENGLTSVAFPAAQVIDKADRSFLHDAEVVPGSGDLPLTVGKIIKAKIMLDQSEIEGERYMAVTSTQLGNLLSSTPVTSGDYNTIKALNDGKTADFMGFKFVRSERLPVASNIRNCFAWVRDAVVYKERPIVNARIEQRADRSFRWYAYYEVERGMLRRYDTGVVQINCSEIVF